MRYSILNPSGNITALVETAVNAEDRLAAAAKIMQRHPEVEQVGFFSLNDSSEDGIQATLQMAGDEFCGNASMSAGILYLSHYTQCKRESQIHIRVSGAAAPVEVTAKQESEDLYSAGILMPEALEIRNKMFLFDGIWDLLPVVRLEGISHIIIKEKSPFRNLMYNNRQAAEQAIKKWCRDLSAEGLGLMFIEHQPDDFPHQSYSNKKLPCKLTPLVYVPAAGTLFWENACASGGSAVGMYFAREYKMPVSLYLMEPGGCQSVVSDPVTRETRLSGEIRLTGQYEL